MSAGSGVLTSASAAFTASDVGKTVMIGGAATGPLSLTATVASVQSATQASGAATFTINTSSQNTGPSAEPNETFLRLEQLAPITSISYASGTRTFTVTTAAAAGASTVWNWAFEQPDF